jgi:hypothetical protein
MKKIIIIFTALILLIYFSSCYSYKTLSSHQEYSKYSGKRTVKVIHIRTLQGRIIEFNELYPGTITETEITGLPELKLKYGDQDSVIFYQQKAKYIYDSAICYEVITQNKMGFICHGLDSIKIPFSDIENVHFKKNSVVKTICLVVGIVLPIIII